MKRIFVIILASLLLAGCNSAQPESVQTAVVPSTVAAVPETTETQPAETEPPVIYGSQLINGTYEIQVESSASMFRVVNCLLTVDDGNMTATMTMSGQGYGYVYMGTGKEAEQDTEEHYVPFQLDKTGAKIFTVNVEALNTPLNCAAWSIRKEKWYDRTLVFQSALLPAEAFIQE